MTGLRECGECGLGFTGADQPEDYRSRYYCGPLCEDAHQAGLRFTNWGILPEVDR